MADTDTSANAGKSGASSSGEAVAKTADGPNPVSPRVEAQAGDPYRPSGHNDYSLSIEPEDTGEATIANLFQAVPLEHEGSGSSLEDGEGLGGDGFKDAGANGKGLGRGQGNGLGDGLLPDGATDVVETADGGPNDDGGLGDGEVPQARGLDPTLSQFDLGGDGIQAAGSQVGDGTGGGAGQDDDGSGGGGNEDLGPVVDIDPADNFVQENAAGGTVVGVVAFANDPDAGDTVTYSITDDRFLIDPDSGVITVADGAVIDRETTDRIDIVVTATSTDGSVSTGVFTITIGDENEFSIGPVTDVDAADNFVMENSAGGTVVGVTAFAEDPDATDTVTYSISDSRFVIDPDTGVISVANGAVIDREATPFIDIEVTATSTDGSTSTGTFRVTVGDENEFDIGPVTDVDATDNFVMENSAGGTVVGVTAFAEDPDATDTVTYSITDSRFVIDPDTGVISVANGAVIDREATPFIDIEVTATSTDGSTSTGTFRITIGDENEFSIGPVTDVDATDNFVMENSAGGTVVGVTAFAEDPDATDTVTYSISDSRFVIDPDTGVISVANGAVIDREATPFIDIEVTATSTDGSTSTGTFRITIGDENEFSIGPVTDVDATDNFVMENSAGGTVVGVTAFAEDPDATDTVTYSITDSRFVIDPDTGEISVANGAVIDREATPFIDIEVTATSTDGSTSTGTFRITIGDENEFSIGPVTDVDATDNFVMENSAGGTVVGVTAFAEDPDATDTVTYAITDSRFVIDPDTGEISVANGAVIDREATPFIDIEVTATSTDGSTSTGTFRVTVGDEDEFDVGPVTDIDTTLNTVAENGAGGEYVGITAFAEDPDATDTVTYSITDNRFEIDPDTGVITVRDGVSFDHETMPTVDIEVTATSTDGSTSTGTFTVTITDVNEAPDLDFDPTLGPGTAVTMTFVEETAGYSNVLGVFYVDGSGHPVGGEIVWVDQNLLSAGDTATVYLEGVEADEIGYFLIPDGAGLNTGLKSGDQVTFQQDINGNWQAVGPNGTPLTGQGANVFFSGDGSLNPDGFDYTAESGIRIGFEDLVGGGDKDYDDPVFDQTTFETHATASVYEEEHGAEVGALSVFDPDVGDTHTFSVSDDRFEVVVQNGEYVLKLKDDQALDYETETRVTVDVTVTDSGGLSDTETIVIDVIDIDENTAPVGPVSDTDVSSNFVQENSAGGTVVGVTAFANDPDAFDSVTYSITDSRFVIDPDTGVISVADGAVIDRETTEHIDVEVTATSTDGSTSTGTFRITIGDDDEFDIGPVTDVDAASNTISEFAAGGDVVHITAFADDPDATDTVTYQISGDGRFEIDPDTGVITVADGARFDAETEPAIDVTVTATSTDGSSSTGTFTINITDGNEPPDLVVHLENGSMQFIVNGSFEVYDGPHGGGAGTGWYENPNSIEGWTYNNVDVHEAGHNNYGATDGTHHMDLAARTNGWAAQQIEGQLDGQVYHLSFDMKSRGGVGQSVAEVYWNGELIDTIDPATTGSGWQTYAYDIVGGSGDGSNTLTFVEIGSDDYGGALIDSVSLVSDNRTAVVEEYFGAEIAPLSVIDPDVGDTHTFTLSDDRFEVVVSGNMYMLKLKDDQAFDYETETQVTVAVTATDTGGLSDTEVVVIDVIDIDETNTPIGPLSDADTGANSVMENATGGTYVGLTAFADDPDARDIVTYSITDSRFDIDADTGVVTVANGAVIDREAIDHVDLEVTATSSDGSSVAKTFRIDIGDEDEFDIGPVTDVDTARNTIPEDAGGGTVVGITAFADDPDATDTVSYQLTGDSRFEIDPDTGVITVADGAVFDSDAEPAIDVIVTATSTDGSKSTETFTINVSDTNHPPDLDFDPALGAGTAVTMTFVEETAGYSNVLGVFYVDGAGNPVGGEIVWVNQNLLSAGDTATVYLEGVEAGEIGYFLIPDGADTNKGLKSGDQVTFQLDGKGNWQAVGPNGTPLTGQGANVFFSGDGSLNPKGYDYTKESGIRIGFEDLVGGGDKDFDDPVFDQTMFETHATAAVYEEEFGAEVGTLSVFDPDIGDTHTFTVSDDRFEVVLDNGEYVLKLKDDQALDYETETQVTVEVTATDSGGLSDTETIVIDVIDIDDGTGDPNMPIGPVRDTDTAQNLVAATAAAGMVVGLTAFAQDADAGDTVTYAIDDSRFDIDADTGVVTVADGAVLVAGQNLNVKVTATSSDGTQSSAVFPIEVTSGGSDNSPPDLIVGSAIYLPGGAGGHYDDHHDDHHGHHHDGRKGRHDHDDDSDKPHGHTDPAGFFVPENEAGVELVQLSVVDPDVGDTHTFTVSDERFEVVSDGDNYLLKLKDDAAVDYESERSITIDVTATDSGGLSDTESITLDVVDGSDKAVCETGTRYSDTMVGGGMNDTLYGRGGDDILLGQGGNDRIYGGSGDDLIRGGTGNDYLAGGDGSDLFAYMLGDGHDTVHGGAGGSWIDVVDLSGAADGTPLGAYGADWSVTMTSGTIDNVDAISGEITLSQDSAGYIELADGGRIDFADLEGIQY
ncbi:cadherin domain-containing protein [Roseibium sp. M-1]